MCATCGCSTTNLEHDHGHGHTVTLEQKVLAHNDSLAAENRSWLTARGILTLNLMSSPGSGKTTLLERTIRSVDLPFSVVEGDQETAFDADRIQATGCKVIQINTGSGCHLDASMLATALETLSPQDNSVVFIENVGNLVCPALFDLGETYRVVIMSVTEGEDKPLKYPHMFRTADTVILNKVDLLPYLDFSVDKFTDHVAQVNPRTTILELSATKGTGTADWYTWLRSAKSPFR
jgi:hydrogenase nickel incorporation protein HypB